jgi:hypothetical protein
LGFDDYTFGERWIDVDLWRTAFGISIVDVDQTVGARSIRGTQQITWAGAAIDPETVAAAVTSDPGWSEDLRTVEFGDDSYYAWTDAPSSVDLDRLDPVRPNGRGGCLYATDGLAIRAVDCRVIESALAARSGEIASLADLEPLADLATALQDAGAYAGFLTMDVGLLGASEGLSPSGEVDAGPGLLPYLAAGTGAGLDGEKTVTIVALVHATDEDAAENASRLEEVIRLDSSRATRRPWSELLTVLDITTDGPLLIARFETLTTAQFWLRLVVMRDSLLEWE